MPFVAKKQHHVKSADAVSVDDSTYAKQSTTAGDYSSPSSLWTCREISVYLILVGELVCDLMVILRGWKYRNEAICCDTPMFDGYASFLNMVYLILVVIGCLLLVTCLVRDCYYNQQGIRDYDYDKEDDALAYDDSVACCNPKDCCSSWNAIFCLMCLNPFIGTAVLWTQLWLIGSTGEAWIWLTREVLAAIFWYVAVYLAQGKLALCTLILQCLHWAPLAVVAFMIWYLQDNGGMCYLSAENTFWMNGHCDLCPDGYPPSADGRCPDGDIPTTDTFCGADVTENFCFFGF